MEWEYGTPLTEEAMAALRRTAANRVGSHDGWVFPSPGDPNLPCSRNIMRDWWNAAQRTAGLGDLPRLGWHSLRRKFANDLRHVPLKDLATFGGWKGTQTLLKCYLKEDETAMVEALRSRRDAAGSAAKGRRDVGDETGARTTPGAEE